MQFLKILCSIPVILISLYFIPFIGIILIIMRLFLGLNRKSLTLPITLLVLGVIAYIPRILVKILNLMNKNVTNIPYLNKIVTSNYYEDVVSFGKLAIILSIILFIMRIIFQKVFAKASSLLQKYMMMELQNEKEVSRENDLKVKLKQIASQNTEVVICPYCGADNILTSKVGTCKFCRKKISKLEKEN